MGDQTGGSGQTGAGGAAARVRDYLRWRPRGRRTGGQIVVQSVASGVLFTILMTTFDAVTGWEDVSVGSVLFRFTFFTLFMIGAGFVMRPGRPGRPGRAAPPARKAPPAGKAPPATS